MKTKNKIISILMCLSLALASGCSQESGGESGTTPANTSAGNTGGNGSSTGDNSANTNSNGAEVTEAENPIADERFAYYDLLSAEYAKCGKLYSVSGRAFDNTGTGKLLIQRGTEVKVHDVEKNAFTTEVNLQSSLYQAYYLDDGNGCLYVLSVSDNVYSKYDSKGNLIAQTEKLGSDSGDIRLMPDGTLFNYHTMYSSDWKTKTELPVLQIEGEHGIKKDVDDYLILGKYGSNVYVYTKENDSTYYCLNTDTMTWSSAVSDLNNFACYSSYSIDIIGRYLFIGGYISGQRPGLAATKIYDMETDTVIATVTMSSNFFEYNGRNYSLWLDHGVLSKTRYPGDGSEAATEIVFDTGDTSLSGSSSGEASAVTEKYYRYQDQYGVFLREYGKGEDGEITVWLYNN
ncbi:MAG: hypothetical protein K2N36_03810 [Ruminiclostridium sp.]|nr:hypothetical protein [Ruminiclostridium sp.]